MDNLFHEHHHWLHVMALNSIERTGRSTGAAQMYWIAPTAIENRAKWTTKPSEEARPSYGSRPHRWSPLLLEDLANDITAREAANAVWLGASLADLGSASGSTRQAARKRWPDLGQIYRMRRWLSGHHEDILKIADRLSGERRLMTPKKQVTQDVIDSAFELLDKDIAQVRADFRSGSMVTDDETGNTQIIRWQRLSELVDKRVRLVVDLVVPMEPDAQYIIDGAKGMLAYYDAVNATPSR